MTTKEKERLTVADALYAVERLLDWANNEAMGQPSTFAKFLSLTGNLEQEGAVWAEPCGYLECSLLASALEAWATHPNDVRDWLAGQGV
jgi:hypothetical protein